MSKDKAGVSDKLTATPLPGSPAPAINVPPASPGAPTAPPDSTAMRTGIIRENVYKDNLGNRLIERIPVQGMPPPSKFVGVRPSEIHLPADVHVAMGMSVRAEILEFAVPGDDPIMAFTNYDTCFGKAVIAHRNRVSEEVNRIRRILADMQQTPAPANPAAVVAVATPTVNVPAALKPDAPSEPPAPLTATATPALATPTAPLARKAPKGLTKGGAPAPSRTPPQGPPGSRGGRGRG